MCATGRCAEGMRYSLNDEGDDRYHNNLRLHPEIAWRNATRDRKFVARHENCSKCDLIRKGF